MSFEQVSSYRFSSGKPAQDPRMKELLDIVQYNTQLVKNWLQVAEPLCTFSLPHSSRNEGKGTTTIDEPTIRITVMDNRSCSDATTQTNTSVSPTGIVSDVSTCQYDQDSTYFNRNLFYSPVTYTLSSAFTTYEREKTCETFVLQPSLWVRELMGNIIEGTGLSRTISVVRDYTLRYQAFFDKRTARLLSRTLPETSMRRSRRISDYPVINTHEYAGHHSSTSHENTYGDLWMPAFARSSGVGYTAAFQNGEVIGWSQLSAEFIYNIISVATRVQVMEKGFRWGLGIELPSRLRRGMNYNPVTHVCDLEMFAHFSVLCEMSDYEQFLSEPNLYNVQHLTLAMLNTYLKLIQIQQETKGIRFATSGARLRMKKEDLPPLYTDVMQKLVASAARQGSLVKAKSCLWEVASQEATTDDPTRHEGRIRYAVEPSSDTVTATILFHITQVAMLLHHAIELEEGSRTLYQFFEDLVLQMCDIYSKTPDTERVERGRVEEYSGMHHSSGGMFPGLYMALILCPDENQSQYSSADINTYDKVTRNPLRNMLTEMHSFETALANPSVADYAKEPRRKTFFAYADACIETAAMSVVTSKAIQPAQMFQLANISNTPSLSLQRAKLEFALALHNYMTNNIASRASHTMCNEMKATIKYLKDMSFEDNCIDNSTPLQQPFRYIPISQTTKEQYKAIGKDAWQSNQTFFRNPFLFSTARHLPKRRRNHTFQ